MRHNSLYRLGGNAVLVGGIVGAVAITLHAPQPMDLAAFSAVSMGPWMAAHWLFAIGYLWLAVAGLVFSRLARTKAGERPGVAAPADAYKPPSTGVPVR
jgi:hypothetical protein